MVAVSVIVLVIPNIAASPYIHQHILARIGLCEAKRTSAALPLLVIRPPSELQLPMLLLNAGEARNDCRLSINAGQDLQELVVKEQLVADSDRTVRREPSRMRDPIGPILERDCRRASSSAGAHDEDRRVRDAGLVDRHSLGGGPRSVDMEVSTGEAVGIFFRGKIPHGDGIEHMVARVNELLEVVVAEIHDYRLHFLD